MQTHDGLIQGSPDWLRFRSSHFGASEAAAMLGVSALMSRDELLRLKHTGESKEFSDYVQRMILDKGHEVEAALRSVAEEFIGEELFPVTCSDGYLSASTDGLTMDESIVWECKQYNAADYALVLSGELPEKHWPQCQQLLLVTKAKQLLFTIGGNGADAPPSHLYVFPEPRLQAMIVAGWKQFAADLAAYKPAEAAPDVIAAPVMELPALSIQVNGSISLISNLEKFGARLNAFVAKIDKEPTDDQGFADAEAAIKMLQSAQDALEAAESNALAQTSDIDDMRKTVKLYADTARTTRLMLEKMVKSRKESIKAQIMAEAKADFAEHIAGLDETIKPIRLAVEQPDIAGAMKNQRLLSSLRAKVNESVAQAKINATLLTSDIAVKLEWYKAASAEYGFLFNDLQQVISKPLEDFKLLVTSRIDAHKKSEADKLEAQRVAMQKEEERKAAVLIEAEKQRIQREAEAKARAEQEEIAESERKRIQEETRKAIQAAAEAEEARLLELAKNAQVSHPEPLSITKEQKQAAVIESGDVISEFLKSRHFADENKVRAILVEFIKFNASFNMRTAA
ncbi:MAG: YqaJ viral recombinase family protein [Thiobacillus sp.]